MNDISRPLSRALFRMQTSLEAKKQCLKDLEAVEGLFKSLPKMALYLSNHHIPLERRRTFLKTAFEGKIGGAPLAMIGTLIKRVGLAPFSQVVEDFRKLLWDEQGILAAEVVTAVPPTLTFSKRMHEKLEKATSRQVIVQERVDPKILGGVVVTIGGRMIDGSIQNRLRQLRSILCP